MMNKKILEDFISIFDVKNIITNSKDLAKYNKDWRGFYKNKSLLKFKSKNEIDLMKSLKKVFDPRNILNPGKIFDI